MSLGGPKDFTQIFSIGRVVGNGTEDSPTGIQDSTMSGNMQIAFPEHGQGVDPQHIALSTSVGTKHGQNMRPFDNGQLVLALKTTGRNDCIILGPMTDILHDKEGMPGNMSGWSWFSPGEAAINWPSQNINEVDGYEDARGLKTQKNKQGKVYKHSNRRYKITNGEYAETVGRKLPSIGQIPTALAQFAGILNPSSFGSLPGLNLNLGKSLKNLSNENKKKIQDSIPPEIWEILLALIDDLKEEQDTISYISDRRVNEEVFIENAVALLSQVTSVADIMTVFNRLISDESLYGLDKLDNIVIEIETAFGNIQQIVSATGNVTQNVSNTVANTRNTMLNSMMSAASFPAGLGDNIFGKDASQIFNMINRVAPQAQAALRSAASRAGNSSNRQKNNIGTNKSSGQDDGKPNSGDISNWG
jgi:hypothetical protein